MQNHTHNGMSSNTSSLNKLASFKICVRLCALEIGFRNYAITRSQYVLYTILMLINCEVFKYNFFLLESSLVAWENAPNSCKTNFVSIVFSGGGRGSLWAVPPTSTGNFTEAPQSEANYLTFIPGGRVDASGVSTKLVAPMPPWSQYSGRKGHRYLGSTGFLTREDAGGDQ